MQKSLSLLASLVLLVTLGLAAQTPATPETKKAPPKPRLSNEERQILKDRLVLTDEQAAKMAALLEQHLAKRDEIRAKYQSETTVTETMRTELQDARKELLKNLDKLLTAEQMEKYRELLGERRKERRQRRGDKSAPGE